MISPKVELNFPRLSDEEIVQKSIDLADYYLVKVHWASHQSVFKAVVDLFKVAYPAEALRLLTGFSAGGGFSGGMCGALCGGIAVLGYIYGSSEPMEEKIYQRFLKAILSEELSPSAKALEVVRSFSRDYMYNRLVEDFKKSFGHADCRELIAPYRENPVSRKRFGSCRRIVRETAGLTTKIILDIERGNITPSIGENIYSHLLK